VSYNLSVWEVPAGFRDAGVFVSGAYYYLYGRDTPEEAEAASQAFTGNGERTSASAPARTGA